MSSHYSLRASSLASSPSIRTRPTSASVGVRIFTRNDNEAITRPTKAASSRLIKSASASIIDHSHDESDNNNTTRAKHTLTNCTIESPIEQQSELLQSSNPDINARSNRKYKKTNNNRQVKFTDSILFLLACESGDIEEAKRLLNARLVDINTTGPDDVTGLHEAVINGDLVMINFLLDQGANINCCDHEGWTPLHCAASMGRTNVVQLLLDRGADATIINCDSLLAYDLARDDRTQQLIGNHLRDFDINILRSQEERMIEEDIDKWIQTGKYEERSHPVTNATVLHVLAAKGHVRLLLKILETPALKKQINLEAKDKEGYTPLLAASFWSQGETVKFLIEHGANIFAEANNGYRIESVYLQEYQNNKLQQPDLSKTKSTVQQTYTPAETKRNLSSSVNDLSRADSIGLTSGSLPRHLKQGQLLKSVSLDIEKQNKDLATLLSDSISVDRLLLRSESMSESDLRKSYKDLVIENDLLKKYLRGVDEKEKQKQQEWIKKERQLQREMSELEEENRLLEQLKEENQRLKGENESLVRVLSKLSKQN